MLQFDSVCETSARRGQYRNSIIVVIVLEKNKVKYTVLTLFYYIATIGS